jgi:hypothetical protein
MSFVGDFFEDVFGGGSDDQPSGGQQAREDVSRASGKSKAIRSALTMTEGGILGEELEEDEVKKRRTLFGN